MTPEETNKLYKKAFRCIIYSIEKDNHILSRIIEFARQYDYLEIQQPVKVISQDERDSHPLLTLDQIAELKARDHSDIYAFLKVETIFQKIKKDVIDIKGKQKQIFERLKKSVEKEKYVINQIQDLKRDRIIGVIGKEHSLIRGIVTYLWLTHPTNSNKPPEWLSCKTPLRQCICSIIGKHIPERIDFLYVPCKGLNETEIKKLLPQIQDKKLNGIETRMVFLGDINCDSRNNVLNMLVGMVEDGFIRKRNIVISMDTLPAEFEDQFEPIYLEPEKQDISASIPQDTPDKHDVPPMQLDGWSVNDNKQEVCWNGKTVTKLPNILYKLFVCLFKKKGKFVKTETLEKCWDIKPDYEKFLVDKMNDLKATLKNKLTGKGIIFQGEIIESKKTDKRKITAYKLPI